MTKRREAKASGFTQLSNIFVDHAYNMGLTAYQRLMISALLRYSFKGGKIFPSLATLRDSVGLPMFDLRLDILALTKRGFLQVTERPGTSNMYDLSGLMETISKLELGVPIGEACPTPIPTGRYRTDGPWFIYMSQFLPKLKLTALDLLVVMLIMQRATVDKMPTVSLEELASTMGRSESTVRRSVVKMREAGYVRTSRGAGRVHRYDFRPLRVLVQKIAVGFPEEDCKISRCEDTPEIMQLLSPYNAESLNEEEIAQEQLRREEFLKNSPEATNERPLAQSKRSKEHKYVLLSDDELPEPPPGLVKKKTTAPLRPVTPAPSKVRPRTPEPKKPRRGSLPTPKPDKPVTPLEQVISNAFKRSASTATRVPMNLAGRREAKDLCKLEAAKPENYNVNHIETLFRISWGENWETPPGRFTMKDKGICKRLLEEYGGASLAKVVTEVVTNWQRFVNKYGVNGRPSMSVIYGYRGSWISEVLDGEVESTAGVEERLSAGSEFAEQRLEYDHLGLDKNDRDQFGTKQNRAELEAHHRGEEYDYWAEDTD
jgi:hypothetical protein